MGKGFVYDYEQGRMGIVYTRGKKGNVNAYEMRKGERGEDDDEEEERVCNE